MKNGNVNSVESKMKNMQEKMNALSMNYNKTLNLLNSEVDFTLIFYKICRFQNFKKLCRRIEDNLITLLIRN